MPGAVRLRLDHAIAQHLREHGSQFYDLLRDDPAFTAWIGAHLGCRGEKRLDRYISEVKAREAERPKRRHAPMLRDHGRRPMVNGPAEDATAPRPFSDAAAPAISYEELQRATRRDLDVIERALEGCLDEYGAISDEALFFKLRRERRETIKLTADLAKRFSADVRDPAVLNRVMERVLQDCSGEPVKARNLLDDINEIIRGAGGLAASGEQS